MRKPLSSRTKLFLLPAFVAASLAGLWFLLREAAPLETVSLHPAFKVSSTCTYGTNHVFQYGGPVDRMLAPLLARWGGNSNAHRLMVHAPEPGSVIWVRLNNPSIAQPPKLVPTPAGLVAMPNPGEHRRFVARLLERDADTALELKASLMHHRDSYFVGGWWLGGTLEEHRGTVLRIEETNGLEISTLRIP